MGFSMCKWMESTVPLLYLRGNCGMTLRRVPIRRVNEPRRESKEEDEVTVKKRSVWKELTPYEVDFS